MGKIKTVHFRDQDGAVIEYLDGLHNFSEWVRQKALSDIAKQKNGVDPEIAAYIDRVLEVKLAGVVSVGDRLTEEAVETVGKDVRDCVEKMF